MSHTGLAVTLMPWPDSGTICAPPPGHYRPAAPVDDPRWALALRMQRMSSACERMLAHICMVRVAFADLGRRQRAQILLHYVIK